MNVFLKVLRVSSNRKDQGSKNPFVKIIVNVAASNGEMRESALLERQVKNDQSVEIKARDPGERVRKGETTEMLISGWTGFLIRWWWEKFDDSFLGVFFFLHVVFSWQEQVS